ncbi:MAG: hypothetical protein HY243_16785 [Proteobacteria bacterium]|nr:hypothetical protein [Pseudomonadota bacterium]
MLDDERAIGAVIEAMYAMISGTKGARDWSLQSKIFHPSARQMRTGVDSDGKSWIKIMSLSDYEADVTPWFMQTDFYEVEIARKVQIFGNIAQAWSAYEARHAPDGAPERRGINSIQLYRGGGGD